MSRNLKIDSIVISECEFKINDELSQPNFSDEIPIIIKPSFFLNDNNPKKCRVTLEIEIFEKEIKDKHLPYYIKAVGCGEFTSLTTSSDNVVNEFSISIVSTLIPYLRAFIASITGMSGMSLVNFPPVNVVEMFSQKELENDDQTESETDKGNNSE